MDTQRVEEIPAKEPKPNAVPLKSALKKKGGMQPASASTPVTPTQEHGAGSAATAAAMANSNGGIGSMAAAAAAAAQQSANQRPLVVRQDAVGNNYSLKWVLNVITKWSWVLYAIYASNQEHIPRESINSVIALISRIILNHFT